MYSVQYTQNTQLNKKIAIEDPTTTFLQQLELDKKDDIFFC